MSYRPDPMIMTLEVMDFSIRSHTWMESYPNYYHGFDDLAGPMRHAVQVRSEFRIFYRGQEIDRDTVAYMTYRADDREVRRAIHQLMDAMLDRFEKKDGMARYRVERERWQLQENTIKPQAISKPRNRL